MTISPKEILDSPKAYINVSFFEKIFFPLGRQSDSSAAYKHAQPILSDVLGSFILLFELSWKNSKAYSLYIINLKYFLNWLWQMENFANLLTAFKKTNSFLQNFLDNLPCDISDPQDFCINCILDMIRGTSITVEDIMNKRSLKDAQILIRTQIDRFIKLKKLCDDTDYARKYINETQGNRLKYIKNAVLDTPEAKDNHLYNSLKKVVTEEMLALLEEDVKANGPELSLWELARQADLLHQYYLPYRFYSDPVHAASAELDDCFLKRGDEIVLIPYGSNKQEELPPTLMFAMHITLEATSITAQFKKMDITEQLKELRTIIGHTNPDLDKVPAQTT